MSTHRRSAVKIALSAAVACVLAVLLATTKEPARSTEADEARVIYWTLDHYAQADEDPTCDPVAPTNWPRRDVWKNWLDRGTMDRKDKNRPKREAAAQNLLTSLVDRSKREMNADPDSLWSNLAGIFCLAQDLSGTGMRPTLNSKDIHTLAENIPRDDMEEIVLYDHLVRLYNENTLAAWQRFCDSCMNDTRDSEVSAMFFDMVPPQWANRTNKLIEQSLRSGKLHTDGAGTLSMTDTQKHLEVLGRKAK